MSDIQQAPIDPKASVTYRTARAAVVVLSILIVIALLAIVVGGVMKMSGHGPARGNAAPASIVLPAGAVIVSTETQGNRLIVRLRTPAGEEIDIVSTEDGHLVARIRRDGP